MTYKKAARLCLDILRRHGLKMSKTVSKQLGYLMLYATEGELSPQMHHEIRWEVKNLPCNFDEGVFSDEALLERMESYVQILVEENPEGGEIDLGWLIKECRGTELWEFFAPGR